MAAIELPADYFTVTAGRFSALVQPFNDALGGIRDDVIGAGNALTGADRDDAEGQLAGLDADQPLIQAAIAAEHGDIVTTPTNDVLGLYGAADGKQQTTDSLAPPAEPGQPGYVAPDLPTVPDDIGDTQGTTPADRQQQAAFAPRPALVAATAGGAAAAAGAVTGAGLPSAGATLAPDVTPASAPSDDAAAAAAAPGAVQAAAAADHNTPVTRGELLDVLNALELTINVQV